jgi:hypothetical protein
MSADSPRHFRLTVSLLQQPRRLHPPPLQCHEIPAYSGWVSHTHTVAQILGNVSILCDSQ